MASKALLLVVIMISAAFAGPSGEPPTHLASCACKHYVILAN